MIYLENTISGPVTELLCFTAGATPEIYQPAFLDPYGRTVGISLRKLF